MNEIEWWVELDIAEGQAERFKELAAEIVDRVREAEAGALRYEWFFNAEDGTCHINETYADSDAILAHFAHFGQEDVGQLVRQLYDIARLKRLEVHGDLSASAAKALSGLGAQTFRRFAGFTRPGTA